MTDAELRARWLGDDREQIIEEVFARLLVGVPLDGLDVGTHDGRIDLRGVLAPAPERLKRFEIEGLFIEELGGVVRFRDRTLDGIDFSAAILESFRFFGCSITNCAFDRARCDDWRLWASDVAKTTFRGTRLRDAMLGAWYEGRGCSYRQVDFSNGDMRGVVSGAVTYIDCEFAEADLSKVEFEGSRFVRCRFAGALREVIFSRDDPDNPGADNGRILEDVDFSDAELRGVEFRGLDLDAIRLPNRAQHLVLTHYPCVLQRARRELSGDERPEAQQLLAVIEHELKWLGPNQEIGVLHRLDLVEGDDEEKVDFAATLLVAAEAECAARPSKSGLRRAVQRLVR